VNLIFLSKIIFSFKAFVDVIALWGLVAATGISFYKINPTAGMLFIPYQVRQSLLGNIYIFLIFNIFCLLRYTKYYIFFKLYK